jgi:membrane fusion protein, multidrug efflux system
MVRLVAVLGFAAFLYAGSAWAQAPAAPRPAVGVVKAEKTPIVVTDRFIGRIQAVQRYNVVARVTGFLDKVVFTEGQEVKAGDVLYRLEQPPFEADVEAKQGAIDQIQAQLVNADIMLPAIDGRFGQSHPGQSPRPIAGRPSQSQTLPDQPGLYDDYDAY